MTLSSYMYTSGAPSQTLKLTLSTHTPRPDTSICNHIEQFTFCFRRISLWYTAPEPDREITAPPPPPLGTPPANSFIKIPPPLPRKNPVSAPESRACMYVHYIPQLLHGFTWWHKQYVGSLGSTGMSSTSVPATALVSPAATGGTFNPEELSTKAKLIPMQNQYQGT